jgi:hypothetical protein
MPGRITVLKGENLTLTTAVNVLAALQSAAGGAAAAKVKIKRLEISQSGSTTLAMVRGQIAKRDTAGTLTATSLAPTNLRPVGGPASGLTGNTNVLGTAGTSGINGTVDSGGTYTELWPFNFPNTAGYLFKPDPDEQIEVDASTVLVIRFKADPSALTGWTFVLVLEED